MGVGDKQKQKGSREQHGQLKNWLGYMGCIHCETESLNQLLCPILSSPAWKQIYNVAVCGAGNLCVRPPYFPTLFFVSYVIIVYFSRCCWRESSCMFQNAQGSVAQQTQIQCLTNHPNQWETREIGMVSPCLHPLSSLQHALVIIGQPMWSSRGTGCNLNQSYFTPREKQGKGKFF